MKFLKIYILAIVTGALCGLITIPYRYLLEKSLYLRKFFFLGDFPLYLHLLIFFLCFLLTFLLTKIVEIAPLITGSGIPQARGQIYGRWHIKNTLRDIALKFIGGVSGIAAGFSLGREGPSVQIGALIGEKISSIFKVTEIQRKYLIMCGSAAGLSSAFTAPLASSIFIAEELEKYYNPRLIIFSFLGAITSGYLASKVFIQNSYLLIPRVHPELSPIQYISILLLFGAYISIIGKVFCILVLYFQKRYQRATLSLPVKLFFITLIVYLMGYFFVDLTAGGEVFLIDQATGGTTSIYWTIFFVAIKLLFSTLCYATGFPGGIFLPLLVIGGLSGKLFALILALYNIVAIENIGFFVFLGMAAAFVVVVRSPATGIILILEMTWDFSLLPSMVISSAFAYTLSYMMNTAPIYDSLYDELVEHEDNSGETELYYEIAKNSYFNARKIEDIVFWENMKITSIKRKNQNLEPSQNFQLISGDIIGISVPKIDIEKYYDALRALAKEN